MALSQRISFMQISTGHLACCSEATTMIKRDSCASLAYKYTCTYAWLIQTLMQRVPTHRQIHIDRFACPCANIIMCNRKSQCPDPKINIACIFDAANQRISLPESNITSHLQNGCLEYYYSFLLGKRPIFRVRTAVSFRECFPAISRYGLTTEQAQNVEIAATTPFGPKKKNIWQTEPGGWPPVYFGGILVIQKWEKV